MVHERYVGPTKPALRYVGQQLMCAVFTQNKGVYINKLNEGSHSIPTLIIDLNKEHVYDLATLER